MLRSINQECVKEGKDRVNLPPWEFTSVYSCLVKFINILQCFPAFLTVIKELLFVTFNLICFMTFASNYLATLIIKSDNKDINY